MSVTLDESFRVRGYAEEAKADGERLMEKAERLSKKPFPTRKTLEEAIDTARNSINKLRNAKQLYQNFLTLFGQQVNLGNIGEGRLAGQTNKLNQYNTALKNAGKFLETLIKKFNQKYPDAAMDLPEPAEFGGKRRKSRKHKRGARKTRRT